MQVSISDDNNHDGSIMAADVFSQLPATVLKGKTYVEVTATTAKQGMQLLIDWFDQSSRSLAGFFHKRILPLEIRLCWADEHLDVTVTHDLTYPGGHLVKFYPLLLSIRCSSYGRWLIHLIKQLEETASDHQLTPVAVQFPEWQPEQAYLRLLGVEHYALGSRRWDGKDPLSDIMV